jgi:DNA primase
VIVEGPLDAIAVSGATGGRYGGLAPCGTALTAQHLAALDAVVDLGTSGIIVAFDSDEAGRHAAVRAYHLLIVLTSDVAAVALPPGHDPAQVLADHGPEALAAILAERIRPLADLVVDAELDRWSRWLDHAEGQINALRAAAPLIAAMPVPHVARQVARVSERLGLSHTIVTSAVTDVLPEVIAHVSDSRRLRGPPTHALPSAQQDFPTGPQEAIAKPTAPSSPSSRPRRTPRNALLARRVSS